MWRRLKAAFPENETNSRILLATRNKDVASRVDRNAIIHKPGFLDDNQSWELFEKAFGKHLSTSNISFFFAFFILEAK